LRLLWRNKYTERAACARSPESPINYDTDFLSTLGGCFSAPSIRGKTKRASPHPAILFLYRYAFGFEPAAGPSSPDGDRVNTSRHTKTHHVSGTVSLSRGPAKGAHTHTHTGTKSERALCSPSYIIQFTMRGVRKATRRAPTLPSLLYRDASCDKMITVVRLCTDLQRGGRPPAAAATKAPITVTRASLARFPRPSRPSVPNPFERIPRKFRGSAP
jgi:hypothetical protein